MKPPDIDNRSVGKDGVERRSVRVAVHFAHNPGGRDRGVSSFREDIPVDMTLEEYAGRIYTWVEVSEEIDMRTGELADGDTVRVDFAAERTPF